MTWTDLLVLGVTGVVSLLLMWRLWRIEFSIWERFGVEGLLAFLGALTLTVIASVDLLS